MTVGPLISRNDSRYLGLNLWGREYNGEDMKALEQLFDEGHVVPIIDRCFSLSEVPEGLRYLENGQALGKLTISVEDSK